MTDFPLRLSPSGPIVADSMGKPLMMGTGSTGRIYRAQGTQGQTIPCFPGDTVVPGLGDVPVNILPGYNYDVRLYAKFAGGTSGVVNASILLAEQSNPTSWGGFGNRILREPTQELYADAGLEFREVDFSLGPTAALSPIAFVRARVTMRGPEGCSVQAGACSLVIAEYIL